MRDRTGAAGSAVATKTQVESKLREMIGRLDGAAADMHANLAKALPDRRVIQIDVPDLDASYWTELAGGRMGKLHRGEAPERPATGRGA